MKAKTLGIVAVVVVVLGSVVWLVTKPANKVPGQEIQTEISPSDSYGTTEYGVPDEEPVAPESAPEINAVPSDGPEMQEAAPSGESEMQEQVPVEGDDLGN